MNLMAEHTSHSEAPCQRSEYFVTWGPRAVTLALKQCGSAEGTMGV